MIYTKEPRLSPTNVKQRDGTVALHSNCSFPIIEQQAQTRGSVEADASVESSPPLAA